jgi:hypothetical protein
MRRKLIANTLDVGWLQGKFLLKIPFEDGKVGNSTISLERKKSENNSWQRGMQPSNIECIQTFYSLSNINI